MSDAAHTGQALRGGWGQDVAPIRIGDTVRRQQSANSAFVHDVLIFLSDHRFGWAPRYLGIDEHGREMVQYINGYVPHGQDVPAATWSFGTLTEIFRELRRLHDLTSGSHLAAGEECVCHGDLSHANTVYRDGRAVAFIDWDWAHPGRRIDDLAYALLQYLSIGEFETSRGPSERARLARALIDAYGLIASQRAGVVDTMLGSLLATRARQLAAIDAGTPAGRRFAQANIPQMMLERHEWLDRNKAPFRAAFR